MARMNANKNKNGFFLIRENSCNWRLKEEEPRMARMNTNKNMKSSFVLICENWCN